MASAISGICSSARVTKRRLVFGLPMPLSMSARSSSIGLTTRPPILSFGSREMFG